MLSAYAKVTKRFNMTKHMHLSVICSILIHFYVEPVFGDCGASIGEYGLWNPWDSCDESCGGGNQSRWRSICCPVAADGNWFDCRAQYNKTEKYIFENRQCSETCLNGGNFIRETGCVCPARYEGRCCETEYCSSTPCKNGGICVNQENGYSCICDTGFKGHQCSEIEYCSNTSCKNGGSCLDQGNGFSCICAPGFKGHNCSDTDDCAGVTCPFGQTCVDKEKGHKCTCITVHLGNVDICTYYLTAIPICLTIFGVCIVSWLIRRGMRKRIKVLPESASTTSNPTHKL